MATTATKRRNGRKNSDVQARLNALRGDLDALQQDMKGLVGDIGGAASTQVHGALETASDTVERAGEWTAENLDGVRETVRTQPLAACMLSMSAGAIIGALLMR